MREESAGGPRLPKVGFAASVRTLVVVGVLFSGVACSSSSPSSNGTAPASASGTNAAYCDDLQALGGNIDQLRALNTSTVSASQIQAILTDAQNNLNKAAQDATGSASVKINAIKTAFSALTAALSAVPSSASATHAFQQVQPEIAALVAALNVAKAGTGCPSATSS